jgi:hypothetical protein
MAPLVDEPPASRPGRTGPARGNRTARDRLAEHPDQSTDRLERTRKDDYMGPIHIPGEWHDHDLLTFEQFCELIHIPPRTVRDWRRRDIGPRWSTFEGCGRLYIVVAEVRRFVNGALPSERVAESTRRQGRTV